MLVDPILRLKQLRDQYCALPANERNDRLIGVAMAKEIVALEKQLKRR